MDTGAIKQTTTNNNNNNKSPVAVLWEAVRRSSAAGGRPLSLGAERGYEGKGFLGAAAGVRNGSVVGKGTERAAMQSYKRPRHDAISKQVEEEREMTRRGGAAAGAQTV